MVVSMAPVRRPSTITCVLVDRMYDACRCWIQVSQQLSACCLPPGCVPPWLGAQSLGSCVDLADSRCDVAAIVPTGIRGMTNVTLVLSVVVDLTCLSCARMPAATILATTTTALYNPPGTTVHGTIDSAASSTWFAPSGDLDIRVRLCLKLETTAKVPLRVPTYGPGSPIPGGLDVTLPSIKQAHP